MWVVPLPSAVEPLWQVSQVPLPRPLAAEWTKVAVSQLDVDLWQFSQLPVTVEWMGVEGLLVKPKVPLRWQFAHCADTDTFWWNLPGFQLE
jgi:hypothetical protein